MKVTVLGFTGGVGHAVAQAFVDAGASVRALVRDPARAPAVDGVTLVVGDARDPARLDEACADSDVVVHALNLPYSDWDPGMIELTRRVIEVARARELTVLFPGNVYGLGPDYAEPLSEEAPRNGPSRKGAIRNRLERMLEDSGVRCIVLRAGDFFGGRGESSWMHHLTVAARRGRAIQYPGRLDVVHTWAYLPDLARTFVMLAERRAALPRYVELHFEGHVVDGHRWVEAVRAGLGDPDRRVRAFPWWMLQPMRLFVPMFRELFEMRYLWAEPVRMSGARLRGVLGEVPHTPFETAMARALAA